MTFYLVPTRPTFMADVHTVSMGPAVSSNVTDVSPVYPLGVCLTLSIQWYPGPTVVYCDCLL